MRTFSRLLLGLSLIVLFTALLVPASVYAQVGKGFPFDPSWLMHLLLFAMVFTFLRPAKLWRMRWWQVGLLALLLGAGTEGLQWVVGRGPSWLEVGIDTLGGCLGWGLGGALVPANQASRSIETPSS